MSRALDLARNAPAPTSPNPTVGAVVVANGKIVGEGVTEPPTGRHAEAVALDAAGDQARGATLYVTLEPHCFHGRTAPCTAAIIAAGIAEVHYALRDPDPRVNGEGHRVLESAGVRVIAGEGEDEARRDLEAYVKHRETGLPFVVAKFAASLDGRIAAASGDSRWVSGPTAREWSHRMRTRIDAIICRLRDDHLGRPATDRTARMVGMRNGSHCASSSIVAAASHRWRVCSSATDWALTLVATSEDASPTWRASIEATGTEVLTFAKHGDRVDLEELLQELARRDVVTALVEGGGVLLGGFFDRGLVDKVHAIIAPIIVGAADAPGAVAGEGAYRMADALRLRDVIVDRLGEDILVTGYPAYVARTD